MSLAITVTDHWSDGRRIHVIGTIAASGNYSTFGDTLSFNNPAIKSSKKPLLVEITGVSVLQYRYIPGTTRDNGKVRMTGVGGAQAVATITSTGVNVSNNDTLTLGYITYTFKTVLTGAANEVLIGASASASLDNLKSAVNASAGAGTTYGNGTTPNLDLTAGTKTATTILFTAAGTVSGLGTSGNSLASTTTAATLSFGGATFASGTDNTATGAEVAAGAYSTGILSDTVTFEAYFPQLR